jgi:hypothetical protein
MAAGDIGPTPSGGAPLVLQISGQVWRKTSQVNVMIQDLQMLISQLVIFSVMHYFEVMKSWRHVILAAILSTVLAGLMRRYVW